MAAVRARCARSIAVLLVALAAFAALQYFVPQVFRSIFWGHNPLGALHWRSHLGLSALAELPPPVYQTVFRLLLLVLWAAYALVLLFAWRGGAPSGRVVWPVVATAAIVMAIFCPPTLTSDVYAYAAHGRLHALYGQNPYLVLPGFLRAVGDPVGPFLVWDYVDVYGPAWTLLSATIVAVSHGAALWWQIMALKLVEAAALLLAATAGRRIAERLAPGRGNLTFLAIGLNPLLLIEGPASGHNDLLLMALLLWSAAFGLRGRYGLAGLLLGLSAGVKFVTLAALPWLILEAIRGRRPAEKWRLSLEIGVVALLPLILCYLPYWHGTATLSGVLGRSQFGQSPAGLARDLQIGRWMEIHGIPHFLAALALSLWHQWPVLAVYSALSLWVRRQEPGAWLTAWAVLAPCVVLWTLGYPFPWYFAWGWTVAATRWTRMHLGLQAACFTLALLWECLYSIWQHV